MFVNPLSSFVSLTPLWCPLPNLSFYVWSIPHIVFTCIKAVDEISGGAGNVSSYWEAIVR